jgi:rare lipoprotein A
MSESRPRRARHIPFIAGLSLVTFLAAGCGHKRQPYPQPTATAPPVSRPSYPAPPPATGRIPITPLPEGGISAEDKEFILSHRPIWSEVGGASWYTAPYKGRHSANGQVFRDDALTAAHRTLPMGSLVVVTNLVTRQASAMRISDRGPFVPDKILDLTKASAKSIGIWPGTGRVRIDVYEAPKPIAEGGRWCVQIGPLTSRKKAIRLKAKLLEKYRGSRVIEFPGERSFWVRIRPEGDDREQAEQMASHIDPGEGVAYLTRLD